MINRIISNISPEKIIKFTPVSYWVALDSKSGSVEGKLYFPTEVSDKLIIFEPGFPGGGSTQFEELWLNKIRENGYTVFLVRHNGTIINGKFSNNYLNCPERQDAAKKDNQKFLGTKEALTISDWLIEPKIAIESLGDSFKEIYLVGHSFGPLAIINSIIDLSLEKSELVSRIVKVISLAGAIGRARGKDDSKLKIWHDHLNTDWARERVEIGSAEDNTSIFAKAHNKIHDSVSDFPKNIEFIGVTPFGDSLDTMDTLVDPLETVDFIASLGRGYLLFDKTQHSDSKIGRIAHDMENLTSDTLIELLNKDWRTKQQINVLKQS